VNDEGWRRSEVQSPCVKLCVLHPEAKVCLGCHRTLEEIARWSRMSDDERARVLAELPGRKPASTRRGGRAGRLGRSGPTD
jgi:predicted Fe-S protein YdhL (DUF1289 family)